MSEEIKNKESNKGLEGDEKLSKGEEVVLESEEKSLEGDEESLKGDEVVAEGEEKSLEGDETLPEGDESVEKSDEELLEDDKESPEGDKVTALEGKKKAPKSKQVVKVGKKSSKKTKKEPVVETTRWYSLRVISGKERKIKERLEMEIQASGWKDGIIQIIVPTEKVYKIRNGKRVISDRNILPGYILVEAYPSALTGEAIRTLTNIPNVMHFLGRNEPIPMSAKEANRMLGKVDESNKAGEALLDPFIVGELVKIIDGPFSDFVGDIVDINEEKKKLKVIVKIFGRGTEVELNFLQVEKQS